MYNVSLSPYPWQHFYSVSLHFRHPGRDKEMCCCCFCFPLPDGQWYWTFSYACYPFSLTILRNLYCNAMATTQWDCFCCFCWVFYILECMNLISFIYSFVSTISWSDDIYSIIWNNHFFFFIVLFHGSMPCCFTYCCFLVWFGVGSYNAFSWIICYYCSRSLYILPAFFDSKFILGLLFLFKFCK